MNRLLFFGENYHCGPKRRPAASPAAERKTINMTNLQCGVSSCANNAQGCCCLQGIEVGGTQASQCADTCCASFQPQNGAMQNGPSQGTPHPNCQISCAAQSCTYNAGGSCTAAQVTVRSGPGQQTECATFRQK